LFYDNETSTDELLKQADLAMYKSKSMGRNGLRFFDPAMQMVVVERTAMEMDLRTTIQDNQFVLHYQAQVGSDGRATGAEALVRWQHPHHGMLSPDDFILWLQKPGCSCHWANGYWKPPVPNWQDGPFTPKWPISRCRSM